MTHIVRRLFLLVIVCMVHALACHADWFKGKVINAETGEPLVGATIRSEVNPQPSWSIQNSAVADSIGCFIIHSGWEGRILFTFGMIGFKNQRKVDYSYGKVVRDTTDVGTIKLQPTALMLQEAVVTAKIPRITMRGDTIVFNPEAFKLKEGARLDELIKKLPGVENRDGKLYWNNKPIRLMMNGKDIFGGDQIVGELPAEVAQKIKLYNRKSELSRHTGKDDGEEDNVLDIQVKPGFLDKWYGVADAYYQTTDRYMFDLTANRLSDHDPQMVFAQANNRNRYIDKSMRMSMDSNIDGDGKSQFGSYNYQHNWQTKGAEKLSNNRVDLSASMSHRDGWNTDWNSTETFFPNEDRTMSLSKTYHNNHTLNPRLTTNLFAYADSLNSFNVGVRASYEKTRGLNKYEGASYSYSPDQFQYFPLATALGAQPGDALYDHLVTRNRNYQRSDGDQRSLTVNYNWTHYLGGKGSFTLSGSTTASGENNDTYNNRNLEYLRESRLENQWQRFDYLHHDVGTSLSAALDYWLTKDVYFNISDQVSYGRQRSRRNVFVDTDEAQTADGVATTPDAANHHNATTKTWTNQLTLKSTLVLTKKFQVMPKFDWTATREDARYEYGQLDTATVRNSHTLVPSVFLKWKLSRTSSMDLRFDYATTVPKLTSTFDFRNTIDPLNIATGNARLSNSHRHTTTFGLHRMWLRKQIVLDLRAAYSKDINPLGSLFSYNTLTGVYTSKPVNVKGGDQWTLSVNYDQGIGVDFRLQNKLDLTRSQAYGYLTLLDDNTRPALNHQKRYGLEDNLSFNYEVEKVQLELFDGLAWNRYRYDATAYNSHPLVNRVGVNATFEIGPFELWLQMYDQFHSGYQTTAMNGHRLLANAYIQYKFCKNRCSLMLYGQDLFNKDVDYDSDYSSYQRVESSSDYMHHYAYLKFTYRFDAKESKNKKK